MKRFGLALAIVAALSAMAAPASSARTKVRSSVTIVLISKKPGKPLRFEGTVSSPNRRCRSNRKVVIWQRLPGPDVRLGPTYTSPNARWVFTLNLNAANGDRFYAKIARKHVRHKRVCRAARSANYSYVA